MRNKHFSFLVGLCWMFTCCAGLDFAAAQEQAETVTCPPNSHWTGQGTGCECDAGFVAPRGENRCVPESQACQQYGPAHLVGNDCVCNEGYSIPAGGSRCEPVTATCPPNSHPQGSSCFCNEGYGNIDGKCVSLAAACAKFNARWSPAKGDCECPPGFHEDTAANKCVPDAPPKKTAASEPAPGVPAAPPPNSGQDEPRVPAQVPGSDLFSGPPPETGAAATERKVNAGPAPVLEQESPPVAAGGGAKGDDPSGWWGKSGQEPAPGAEPPLPKSVTGQTPAAEEQKEQTAGPAAEAFGHQAEAPPPAASDDQAREKMPPPRQPPAEREQPGQDVYQDIGAPDSPVLEKTMAQSLRAAPPEKKQELAAQLQTLREFDGQDAQEVSLQNKGLVESAKETYLQQEYLTELQQWHRDVQEAEATGKVREGADKEDYLAKAEDEKRLKSQIAELDKTIGFNHLRLVEAAGVQKYETMPADYRAHFTKSAADDFNAASERIESEKAFRNIAAMSQQARELKAQLKKKYPRGWQDRYLDLPAKPRLDDLQNKVDTNIFVLFERKTPR